jgi:hypothetical protein
MVSMMSSAKEKNPPADNEMHLDAAGSTSAKDIKGWSVMLRRALSPHFCLLLTMEKGVCILRMIFFRVT